MSAASDFAQKSSLSSFVQSPFSDRLRVLGAEILCGVSYRHAHVCSRISVRNRENIELVYFMNILLQSGIGAEDHLLEGRRVNIIFQSKKSSEFRR